MIILVLFGLVNLYFTSTFYSWQIGRDPFYFVSRQLTWLAVGFPLFFLFSALNYRFWRKGTTWLVGWAVAGLAITLIINDTGMLGASRSLYAGSVRLSELAQLIACLFFADYLSEKDLAGKSPLPILLAKYAGVTLTLAGLILVQPDFSEALLLIAIALFCLYLAGLNLKYFMGMLAAIVVGVWILLNLYVSGARRLTEFIHGLQSFQDASYHVQMALSYIATGGLFGTGFGSNNFASLPVGPTDSVFATIVSNVGSLGAFFVLILYGVLFYLGFQTALHSKTTYGRLLAGAITFNFAARTLLHISSMLGLVPILGIALPLLSYGGTNLTMTMVQFGILVSISRDQDLQTTKR